MLVAVFYVIVTSKVMSAPELTCGNAHSWRFYSAASLRNRNVSSITWYLTQSHYADTELTSPFSILLMPSVRLGSDEYQFYKSLVWPDQKTPGLPHMGLGSTEWVTAQDGCICGLHLVSSVGKCIGFDAFVRLYNIHSAQLPPPTWPLVATEELMLWAAVHCAAISVEKVL